MSKSDPGICTNCGNKGPHYVGPSFGESGFFICDSPDWDRATNSSKVSPPPFRPIWAIDPDTDYHVDGAFRDILLTLFRDLKSIGISSDFCKQACDKCMAQLLHSAKWQEYERILTLLGFRFSGGAVHYPDGQILAVLPNDAEIVKQVEIYIRKKLKENLATISP